MVNLGDFALGVNAIARREHQVVHDRAAAGLDLETELDHAGGIRSGAVTDYHTPNAEPRTASDERRARDAW